MDEIVLTQKVSSTNHEAPEFLDSDYDVNNLYEVKIRVLNRLKKILTDVRVRLNTKRKNNMRLKIKII